MVHLLRVEEEYRLELREIRFDSSMPVSYTHLDVYKRQDIKYSKGLGNSG